MERRLLRPGRTRRNGARLSLLGLAARALAPGVARRSSGQPQRVLLLRPDHIGDVLLTAPAVALLRASLPNAHLTYVVGPWSADAARHGPRVDELWTLPFPGFSRRPNASLLGPYALLARSARQLRDAQFDLAIMLRPDHWWGALLALAAGIPVRVGGSTPETAALLTHARRGLPGEHWAEQSLGLARLALQAVGMPAHEASPASPARASHLTAGQHLQPVFQVGQAATAAADQVWQRHGLAGRRVVAIHPNAGAPLKSWPVDSWASLADGLLAHDVQVVLVGAPADGPLLAAIQTRMARPPAFVACGQSLEASAAIYVRSTLLVGLDSGAAHLAAAVGTPTLRLYGPASAGVFGPWPARRDQQVLVAHGLACVPCGHLAAPPCGAETLPACLLALGVADVLNAVEQQLKQG